MSITDQLPEICQCCQHLKIGIGLWDERDTPSPGVWLSVKISARCMMEISPDGACQQK